MDTERQAPHNLEMEEAALGAMLLSLNALDVVAGILTAGDFYKAQHELIYKALMRLRSQGKDPDVNLLAEELKSKGQLEAAGDKLYLTLLSGTCPNPGNAGHYARVVKEAANRRRLIAQAQHIENAAYIDQAPEELLAEIQRLAFDVETERHIGGTLEAEADAFPAFMAELEERQAERDFIGLDSGFEHFNRVCNGLGQGLFVIAGAPSCGKTTLVKQMLDQVASLNGVPCLFFSLEQSAEELRIKTLSRLSGIENRDIMRGRLATGSGGWGKVKEAAEELAGYAERVYLVEADKHTTVDTLRLTASRAMRRAGADRCFICVDYLQKMPAGEKFDGAKERMDFLTSELRRLSRDLDSPVLVISSENRFSYGRKDLAVFKESGEIEYSADIAGVLLEEERQGNLRMVNLHIVKNRNGERATIQFDFDPQISTFKEIGRADYRDPEG